jgi:excisionase family DNA binding protein
VMDLITAAKYLGFHPVTLREWKRKGEGPPGRKVGGRWRFLKSALDDYLLGTPAPSVAGSLRPDVPPKRRPDSIRSLARIDAEYRKALGLLPDSTKPTKVRGEGR